MLGAVTGGVQGSDAQGAELELPAVIEGLVLVVGLRLCVDVDDGARGRGETPVPGHVIGVVVRLEDVLDAHAHVAREPEVFVDVELGVDDRGKAGVLIPDQVRGAAKVVVGDLAEDHRAQECLRLAPGAGTGAMPSIELERWQSLVDCSCLESSRSERARGFESLPLRLCSYRWPILEIQPA